MAMLASGRLRPLAVAARQRLAQLRASRYPDLQWLEVPDAGSVLFHGQDATHTDVRDRQVGFVFQHYALFAQMTIFENVAFGLRVRPKAKIGRAHV